MIDRTGSLPECIQVRIKVRKKDKCWCVGLVYDLRRLRGVTTVRLGVAEVLQLILNVPSRVVVPCDETKSVDGEYI
jgi:hypothetical protein